MATLPDDFRFSQGSLQDFVDCHRRFQLRYLLEVAWPAVEVEPALDFERHVRQGAAFHRLVHQHMLGLPVERLSRMVDDAADPDLSRWWRNYLEHPMDDLPPRRYPEVTLSAPVRGHRLVAKYDLVAVEPGGRAVIVDWKTAQRRTDRRTLLSRLQTTVYRYVLVQAGAHLNGGEAIAPEQVEMRYWFADFPHDPERLPYNAGRLEADAAYLQALVEDIKGRKGDADFPLTEDERRCRFCQYRSLCERGVTAGTMDEAGDAVDLEAADLDLDIDLDFDQIAEIEF
ncbi:MAG: PD-(D/E)XK nuclease family protein [Anaerolineae bacterium]|nr:PD-(D/E)XK nuclease family protein [Anaerolineae bacterium]